MISQKYDFKTADNIRVIARFRPSSETEKREEKQRDDLDGNVPKFRTIQEVVMKRPGKQSEQKPFKCVLDHIFKMSTTQKKVFELVGRPMVQAVLEGYNATIFAYGQTGSGKTYTMFGPEKKKKMEMDLGLVQRACTYLFDKLRKLSDGVSAEVVEWQVTASFIQLYKEHLSDLLEPKGRSLRIRTDFNTDTPYVENLKNVSVNSIEQVLINLGIAFSNRIVASHKLNSVSSRSHMLLMLTIEQKTKEGAIKRSKLNFGDLAGSEDIRKALGPNPDKERQKEAIAINSSLTALTTAINNLSTGQRPSYRASPLTHILQDSLGGNSKTTMLVAASPHCMNRSETIRTLRFAMTAKKVTNKAKINKELTKAQLLRRIEELEALNGKLKTRVIELEQQMQAAGFEVELSTDLYGDASAASNNYSSDEEADDADNGGGKSPKKSKSKKKNKKGIIAKSPSSPKGGVRQKSVTVDNAQIDALKKEINAANDRANGLTERNAKLEKITQDLGQEIDSVTQRLQAEREKLDEMNKQSAASHKERLILEARNDEMQKEYASLQTKLSKQTEQLDKQIARQRTTISMRQAENKDLQKAVKELNLENEDLLKQNDSLTKQMAALKQAAFKSNPNLQSTLPMDEETMSTIKELNDYQLEKEEQKMEPADLLMHRFAATEANDLRLTPQQRMKKTAKMMTDMSEDINRLMAQWLPKNKVRGDRKQSKTLVFQVRQLIGHFNVLVTQMKSTEQSYQNDLKLDIVRRDKEIKQLKEQNKQVHALQDDLQEKDEMISELTKQRDDIRVERDHLKAQTVEQQDMIFDVQNQVRYLNQELDRNRTTIIEMNKAKQKRESQMQMSQVLDLNQILDGNEDFSDSESESDSSSNKRKKMKKVSKNNGKKKRKSIKQSRNGSNKRSKHQKMESEEIMYMSDEDEEDEESEEEYDDQSKNTTVLHEDESVNHSYDFDEAKQQNNMNGHNNGNGKSSKKRKRRKSTMSMWREGLKVNDQLDCKDESGLWWTARIISYKNGNSDKLQIRYDGWGDQYDEYIDRVSDRLAVYKSMFHSKDKGGKKLIREGYMSKEGKMFKTWRKRYFTLSDQGKLTYYHKQGQDNAIGSVDVTKMIKTERTSFGRNKQFGVQIHTDVRVWKFLCQSEQELAEWIHALNFVRKGVFDEE